MALPIGSRVEVASQDSGYAGSWFTAKLLKRHKGLCRVQYEQIEDERGTLVIEELKESQIRPLPPKVVQDNYQAWQVGHAVEALENDGWWQGSIIRRVDTDKFEVFFRDSSEQNVFHASELRTRQDWNDCKWIIITENAMGANRKDVSQLAAASASDGTPTESESESGETGDPESSQPQKAVHKGVEQGGKKGEKRGRAALPDSARSSKRMRNRPAADPVPRHPPRSADAEVQIIEQSLIRQATGPMAKSGGSIGNGRSEPSKSPLGYPLGSPAFEPGTPQEEEGQPRMGSHVYSPRDSERRTGVRQCSGGGQAGGGRPAGNGGCSSLSEASEQNPAWDSAGQDKDRQPRSPSGAKRCRNEEDVDRPEKRQKALRAAEGKAYAAVLAAFYEQAATIDFSKQRIMADLRRVLNVSNEAHAVEVQRLMTSSQPVCRCELRKPQPPSS